MVINNLFHFPTSEALHCAFYFKTFEALHRHFWTQYLYFSPQVALLMRLRFTNCVTMANIKWAAHGVHQPNKALPRVESIQVTIMLRAWYFFTMSSTIFKVIDVESTDIHELTALFPQLTVYYLSRCEILLWIKTVSIALLFKLAQLIKFIFS